MFYFRLARELGVTVSRLLQEADSRELAEWKAYFFYEDQQEKKKKNATLEGKIKTTLGGVKPVGRKS